jgi:2-phosphoglycerate kinase
MRDRLINNRQQPDLVNSNMQNWAKFLHQQAQLKNIPIINTSQKTLKEVVEMIQNQVLTNLVETK